MIKYRLPYLALLTSIASLGGFLFGYHTAVMGSVNLFIQQDVDPYTIEDRELVTSILTLGAAAGALAAGPLADNFGRKRIIIAADVCLALGSILQSAAGSVGVLAAGRLIAGIGVGAAGMVLPVYLSECSPTPLRGRIITVFQFVLLLGDFIADVVSYLFATKWRAVLGLAAVPALLQALGMLFLSESPRWLLKRPSPQSAEQAFLRVYNSDDPKGEAELRSEIAQVRTALQSQNTVSFCRQLGRLFSLYWRGVLIGNGLFLLVQLCGASLMVYYEAQLLDMAGFGHDLQGEAHGRLVLKYTCALAGIELFCTIIMFFLIDRLGRRWLLLTAIPFMGASLVLLSFSFFLIQDAQLLGTRWLSLISMAFYYILYAAGVGAVPYILAAEIYPLPLRATANSLTSSIFWGSSYLTSAPALSLLQQSAGVVFLVLALFCFLTTWFVYKFIKQTKGLALPEIIDQYNPHLAMSKKQHTSSDI